MPPRLAPVVSLLSYFSIPQSDNMTPVHMRLQSIWGEYRNIWWNDADFALALGYLLVGDGVGSVCQNIMRRRDELRKTEVTERRSEAWERGGLTGAGLFTGAFVLTALTGGAAIPVTGPLMAGSWALAAGSGATRETLRNAELTLWNRRREACGKLEEEFPPLKQLFAEIIA